MGRRKQNLKSGKRIEFESHSSISCSPLHPYGQNFQVLSKNYEAFVFICHRYIQKLQWFIRYLGNDWVKIDYTTNFFIPFPFSGNLPATSHSQFESAWDIPEKFPISLSDSFRTSERFSYLFSLENSYWKYSSRHICSLICAGNPLFQVLSGFNAMRHWLTKRYLSILSPTS